MFISLIFKRGGEKEIERYRERERERERERGIERGGDFYQCIVLVKVVL